MLEGVTAQDPSHAQQHFSLKDHVWGWSGGWGGTLLKPERAQVFSSLKAGTF